MKKNRGPDQNPDLEAYIAQRTAELQERADHYRLLFEAESDAIFLIDNQTGRILEANPAATTLYGYTYEELVSLRNVDLSAEPEQTRRVTTETPVDYSQRVVIPLRYHRKKDGTVFAVEMAGRFFVLQGRSVHMVAIRDISERIRTESALRQSREELKAIYDSVPVLMCTLSPDRRVLFANRAFSRFTGLSAEELSQGRACGVLGCINALENPRGCGFGNSCRGCLVLSSINDTFATGREHHNIPYRATLERNGVRQDVVMLGATVALGTGDNPVVLLCLQDVTPHDLAERELRESRSALRALLGRMERIREEERASIAREIHDELGQNLTGIKMDLRWMQRAFTKPDMPLSAVSDRIAEAIRLVDATTAAVQRLAAELRPCVLDGLGIVAALQYEARQFRSRTSIACNVSTSHLLPSLSPDTATALFRIFQECITNVARHAAATRVDATLDIRGDRVELSVRDDGIGIRDANASSPTSMGLLGMRERAAILGGSLTVGRSPGGGTEVTVTIPLSAGSRPS